jgi:hypothetical protein
VNRKQRREAIKRLPKQERIAATIRQNSIKETIREMKANFLRKEQQQ